MAPSGCACKNKEQPEPAVARSVHVPPPHPDAYAYMPRSEEDDMQGYQPPVYYAQEATETFVAPGSVPGSKAISITVSEGVCPCRIPQKKREPDCAFVFLGSQYRSLPTLRKKYEKAY